MLISPRQTRFDIANCCRLSRSRSAGVDRTWPSRSASSSSFFATMLPPTAFGTDIFCSSGASLPSGAGATTGFMSSVDAASFPLPSSQRRSLIAGTFAPP